MKTEIKTPWDMIKVAYATNILDPDAVWKHQFILPKGWELSETDCSGARTVVVIFDVEGILSLEDGEEVRKQLKAIRTKRIGKNG